MLVGYNRYTIKKIITKSTCLSLSKYFPPKKFLKDSPKSIIVLFGSSLPHSNNNA